MGWAVGEHNGRDIGYGVPSLCDHPGCEAEIHRGLAYVCGDDVYGGEHGCGLFFCGSHRASKRNNDGSHGPLCCERCNEGEEAFEPKPDLQEWIDHKATHPSWAKWREEQAAQA